jgi:nucleoside-diphosphate-sugar epimerase
VTAPPLYLVTGGAGFIGSHLVERLLSDGARVRVLDDFSTGRRENLDPWRDAIDLLEGSVADPGACARACSGVDFVLHQAAIPSVPRSVTDPVTTHDVCATGTLRLLVAAREAGVRRFVYAGSSSAYGDTPTLPKREDMTAQPRSPYAVAKLTGEMYCGAFAGVYGMETVTLRYFNIFGTRQDPHSEYSAVIPLFITAALADRSPTIHGDGEQTRDFTHVDNVVQANVLACSAPAEAVAGEVFNVGCGERISLNRLWALIRDAAGASVEARHGPPRAGDVRDSLASLDRIRERMGYEPRVGLEEGLARTVEWFREGSATAHSDRGQ